MLCLVVKRSEKEMNHYLTSPCTRQANNFEYFSLPSLYSTLQHVDNYSRTKSVADKAVLEANGREVKNSDGHLSTCALRCAGIYGEGEQRHFPRIVVNANETM